MAGNNWQKFDEEATRYETPAAAKRDGILLFTGRCIRMFSYGSLTVVLISYLEGLGLNDETVGALLTAILVGDLGVSLWLTSRADSLGRRRCLLIGAVLKAVAGAAFAMAGDGTTWILFPAGVIGVVSSTGGEIGPFLPIEQAALTQALSDAEPAPLFAWYNALGYMAQAAGALGAGWLLAALEAAGWAEQTGYRLVQYAPLYVYTYLLPLLPHHQCSRLPFSLLPSPLPTPLPQPPTTTTTIPFTYYLTY